MRRSPLFAVLSYTDVVLRMDEYLTPQQRNFLETAQASGKELTARLDSVLAVAKTSAADVASNLTPAMSIVVGADDDKEATDSAALVQKV